MSPPRVPTLLARAGSDPATAQAAHTPSDTGERADGGLAVRLATATVYDSPVDRRAGSDPLRGTGQVQIVGTVKRRQSCASPYGSICASARIPAYISRSPIHGNRATNSARIRQKGLGCTA